MEPYMYLKGTDYLFLSFFINRCLPDETNDNGVQPSVSTAPDDSEPPQKQITGSYALPKFNEEVMHDLRGNNKYCFGMRKKARVQIIESIYHDITTNYNIT